MTPDRDEQVANSVMQACVWFLSEDPARINKILRTHRRDKNGLCTSHVATWPCLTRRLAEAAKRHLASIPAPRKATP